PLSGRYGRWHPRRGRGDRTVQLFIRRDLALGRGRLSFRRRLRLDGLDDALHHAMDLLLGLRQLRLAFGKHLQQLHQMLKAVLRTAGAPLGRVWLNHRAPLLPLPTEARLPLPLAFLILNQPNVQRTAGLWLLLLSRHQRLQALPALGCRDLRGLALQWGPERPFALRSEEHTSELQSRGHLVCRLLLEKKNRPVQACCACHWS